MEQLAGGSVVPGAAAGHPRSQIVEVPRGGSIWHFLLRRRVSGLIRSAESKRVREGGRSNTHRCASMKTRSHVLHLRVLGLVEIALPPGVLDHLAGQLLPRMLWADAGHPQAAAVRGGHAGDRGHEAAVR